MMWNISTWWWGLLCLTTHASATTYINAGAATNCCDDNLQKPPSYWKIEAGMTSETCASYCTADAECIAYNIRAGINFCHLYAPTLTEGTTLPAGWAFQAATCTPVCGTTVTRGNGLAGGFCYIKSVGPVSVSGDPVTFFRGVEHKFFLPIGKFTKLLHTTDLIIHASAFPGREADQQWIDRILVDTTVGERVLDVSIRRDLASFKLNARQPGHLETLEVIAPWLNEPVQTMPTDDALLFHWGHFMFRGRSYTHPKKISFEMFKIQHSAGMDPAAPRREGVLVTSGSVKMSIVSSSALEYYYEDRDDQNALEYAHLDMEFIEFLDEPSSCTGLLPIVWGVVPNASKTDAMTPFHTTAATPEHSAASSQLGKGLLPQRAREMPAAASTNLDERAMTSQILQEYLSQDEENNPSTAVLTV